MIIRALLSLFLALAMAGAPAPQQVDMAATAAKLAGKATRKTEVDLDQSLLNLASAFLSDSDADQAAAKRVIAGLKGVYVRSVRVRQRGRLLAGRPRPAAPAVE